MFGAAHSASGARTWEPPLPVELQRSFPQFEICGLLGRGGMGAVYKAWQKSLERFVAIKIFPPGVDDLGMNFAGRFKQEAKAMAQFTNAGIVTVFDAGETADGLLYFIMEYVEGTDVARLLAEHGKLPRAQALSITYRMCEALKAAHNRGIIHRDIKPSNIMLERDGTVKVADFGLARRAGPQSEMHTRSDASLGTTDYIAPEALQGAGEVDPRADLYAVGVMLYQMLTGNVPRGRFDPASTVAPGLDKRIDGIVDRAMQADREKRYATAAEILGDVARVAPELARTPNNDRSTAAKPIGIAVLIVIATAAFFLWKNRVGVTPADNHPTSSTASVEAPALPAWRDAFAESPLREVIANTERTAYGYVLPDNNHWNVSPQSQRSGAVRVRATSFGEKFVSLFVARDDQTTGRVRFPGQTKECALSQGVGGVQETDFAIRRGVDPFDGQPHELLFARVGGRLRVLFDGSLLLDEPDPSTAPGRFVLDVYPGARLAVEKVEYLELDDLPEAEALKLTGTGKR